MWGKRRRCRAGSDRFRRMARIVSMPVSALQRGSGVSRIRLVRAVLRLRRGRCRRTRAANRTRIRSSPARRVGPEMASRSFSRAMPGRAVRLGRRGRRGRLWRRRLRRFVLIRPRRLQARALHRRRRRAVGIPARRQVSITRRARRSSRRMGSRSSTSRVCRMTIGRGRRPLRIRRRRLRRPRLHRVGPHTNSL